MKNGFGEKVKNSTSCRRELRNQGFGGTRWLQKRIKKTSRKTTSFLMDLSFENGAQMVLKINEKSNEKIMEKVMPK